MTAALRWLAWARWPAAIGLLSVFAIHEGIADVLRGFPQAGVTMLWLVPFCPCCSMHADGESCLAASCRYASYGG